jgi:nucleoside-diphosphate-sugar epimerase
VSLRFILDRLIAKAGKPVEVVSAATKQRAHKTSPRLVGSNAKLRSTGWQLQIPFEQTVDDIYEYWRGQVCRSS